MEAEMNNDNESPKLPVTRKKQEDPKSGFYAAIIYFIWPLLSVILAFKNYKHNWAKNILWAFIAFYGFSFAIGAESGGKDIVDYVSQYQNLHKREMTTASAKKYFYKSGEIDIARTFIAVILSRFTGSQAVLTLVYGIILGFFFSRNMWFVLERVKGRLKPLTVLLFICFFLVVPFWKLNGFRFWTATHIFIYGLLPFLFEGKKKGIIISATSILFHFAFLVPVLLLLIYMFLGNRIVIYFAFFILTLFISTVNLKSFNEVVSEYAPAKVQQRTSGYRSKQYVEKYREGTDSDGVWYAEWYGGALRWTVVGFLILLFFRERQFFADNKGWMNLFCFTLLFCGIANLMSSLPSGGRYLSIANLSALALIILYIQNRKQEVVMKRFAWVASPALLLFIIVSMRTGLYSISVSAVFGNPVISFFFNGGQISLNDVMRMIV
jgi:hypothetical protein